MRYSQFFAYRLAAFTRIMTDLFHNLIQPLLLLFLYQATKGIPGWTVSEIIIFNGTGIISWGIASTFFFPMVWFIGWRIDHSHFDILLLRPVKMIPQMIAESIHIYSIPDLITGIVILIIGLRSLDYNLTIIGIISFIYLIILNGLVMYGIAGIIIGLSFKYYKTHNFVELFWNLDKLSDQPLNIYNNIIPFIITFIFPIAIANYYPASFLLGKLTEFTTLLTLTLVSLGFTLLGTISIKYGLKHYTSAG